MNYNTFLLGFMLFLSGLFYWYSIEFEPNPNRMKTIGSIKNDSPNEVRLKFLSEESELYEIMLIGKIKDVSNLIERDKNSDSLYITNASLYKKDEFVTSIDRQLILAQDTEFSRIRIMEFEMHRGNEYELIIDLDKILKTSINEQVDIVLGPDPHIFKNNMITSIIFKIGAIISMFLAVIFLVLLIIKNVKKRNQLTN